MSDFVDSLWVPVLPSLSLSWLVLLLPVLVELKRFIKQLMRLVVLEFNSVVAPPDVWVGVQ